MNILGIGASSTTSIAYHVGEHRKTLGDHIAYASCSGPLGYACDVTDPATLLAVFEKERPEVVILAVGIALQHSSIDSFDDWERQRDDIMARSLGTHAVMIAAEMTESVTHVIALGGRESFEDPALGAYATSNGALWGRVQHANKHARYDSWDVSMPLVIGSANGESLRAAGLHTGPEIAKAIYVAEVVRAVDEILAGGHPPGRITLGKR